MKRPQSAKPGYRNQWGQVSDSQMGAQLHKQSRQQPQRKNIKLVKADLTTNDFARILPKKIYQDKQRLYSQALQLKQSLNQTFQQNIRLKTRISILQKQKQKLTKHMDGREGNVKNNVNSRINMFKNGDKENMMIQNFKKMIREGKEENQYLRQENAKIKKAIKYTKINQLQIQRKMLQQENRRMANMLEEMNNQLANQDSYQRQLNQLKRALDDQQDANQQLNEANLKYMEYIQQLEEKFASDVQKNQIKQNKNQREIALNRRKMNQALKQAEDLRKQLNYIKEQNNNTDKKKTKLTRPVSSNPYKSGLVGVRLTTDKKQQANKQNDKNKQIQSLKEELNQMKIKMQQTQRLTQKQQNQKQLKAQSKVQSVKQQVQPQIAKPISKPIGKQIKSVKQIKQVKQVKQIKQVKQVKGEQNYQQNYQQQQQKYTQYDDSPSKSHITNTKTQQKVQLIDQYKKDFQQQEQQQNLYVKDEKPNKKSKQPKEDKDKNGKQKKSTKKTVVSTTYKPDKKILSQIKELLTYRMKAQRYPYEELKKDILDASEKRFTSAELKTMFGNEPFYLTVNYADALLKYCFEKDKVKNDQAVTNETLLTKIRKVIQNFELIEEKQEEQMLLRIAEMVTQYPQQLESAFQNIKNGQQTVGRLDLIQMFRKLQLDDKYIQVIIQQLSLCSTDLNHLNFHGFFQRFYVQNMQSLQNGQIDQEQMQSSSEQPSKNLKSKNSTKLKQVRKQFQDEELAMDDGERISLGNGREEYQDADIVSDDGPI